MFFTLVFFAVQLRATVKIDEESEKSAVAANFLVHSCNPLETLPGSVSVFPVMRIEFVSATSRVVFATFHFVIGVIEP
jgi:hypothetical protein